MGAERKLWTRDELLVAFNLYCKLPFGRLTQSTPEIIRLAEILGRTPGAVAMKLCNFASFDPMHKARNVKGLANASTADREIWNEFHDNWGKLVLESENVLENFCKKNKTSEITKDAYSFVKDQNTEIERSTKVRVVQRFFRNAVLSSYGFSCAICRFGLVEMINASHIVPWAVDEKRRADPHNGLALCVFHDRAFDRGLITISEEMSIIVSGRAKVKDPPELHRVGLLLIEGQHIHIPERFSPCMVGLHYHRENIFLS